ncbi:CBS domain-containing protein [Sphingomonas sp. ASV193]|uniref:CBS domain-containing protein n=1 Tax=Sphingomonas sp. ASV193 TaxID=3144405 RepID=UPI0032E85CC1
MSHKIEQLMTREVETVTPDATVQEAAGFMLRADTGSIPVCHGGTVVGMITDRDIAVRGVALGRGPDCTVEELMSRDVVCARAGDDTEAVARKMSEAQVRRLPVLDDADRLVGMISLGDLSREAEPETATTALEGVSSDGGAHEG